MINALLNLVTNEREIIVDIQSILSSISTPDSSKQANQNDALKNLSSMLPGGLAGGAAAGGLMALFMGSKSTRKIAKKVVQYGGTAVLGGLAYKAYGNWQKNKAIGQTSPIPDYDIEYVNQNLGQYQSTSTGVIAKSKTLELALITAMIAASKSDGVVDASEHKRLVETVEKIGLDTTDKAAMFELMARDISADEVASLVNSDEHKAEVYLSAYLAIEVDDQRERSFLNELAIALALPKGFPAYLEQQADQGVTCE